MNNLKRFDSARIAFNKGHLPFEELVNEYKNIKHNI